MQNAFITFPKIRLLHLFLSWFLWHLQLPCWKLAFVFFAFTKLPCTKFCVKLSKSCQKPAKQETIYEYIRDWCKNMQKDLICAAICRFFDMWNVDTSCTSNAPKRCWVSLTQRCHTRFTNIFKISRSFENIYIVIEPTTVLLNFTCWCFQWSPKKEYANSWSISRFCRQEWNSL